VRQCRTCGISKSLDDFGAYSRYRDGRNTQCKVCNRKGASRHRASIAVTRPCPGCGDVWSGDPKAGMCGGCQRQAAANTRLAASVGIRARNAAVERASRITKRWLRQASWFRPCRGCGSHVTGEGSRYCTYTCWQNTRPYKTDGKRHGVRASLRKRVFARDGYVCQICLESTSEAWSYSDDLAPEVDHVVPVMMGGTNCIDNLRVAHRKCNRDRNVIEFDLYS
jgi:5-methylcytosine-specific restriction endonuclease McrA